MMCRKLGRWRCCWICRKMMWL